jgi:hypothetical protein
MDPRAGWNGEGNVKRAKVDRKGDQLGGRRKL